MNHSNESFIRPITLDLSFKCYKNSRTCATISASATIFSTTPGGVPLFPKIRYINSVKHYGCSDLFSGRNKGSAQHQRPKNYDDKNKHRRRFEKTNFRWNFQEKTTGRKTESPWTPCGQRRRYIFKSFWTFYRQQYSRKQRDWAKTFPGWKTTKSAGKTQWIPQYARSKTSETQQVGNTKRFQWGRHRSRV